MKKAIALALVLLMVFSALVACSKTETATTSTSSTTTTKTEAKAELKWPEQPVNVVVPRGSRRRHGQCPASAERVLREEDRPILRHRQHHRHLWL